MDQFLALFPSVIVNSWDIGHPRHHFLNNTYQLIFIHPTTVMSQLSICEPTSRARPISELSRVNDFLSWKILCYTGYNTTGELKVINFHRPYMKKCGAHDNQPRLYRICFIRCSITFSLYLEALSHKLFVFPFHSSWFHGFPTTLYN